MAIDELIAVMTTPDVPFEAPSTDGWASVEARLGTSLPEDYKKFINLYGSGKIANFLWIFNPFSSNENLNLERQVELQSAVLGELEEYGEKNPYKSFPAPGGVLPFGITDNGDVVFWRTEGETSRWSVAVNESRAPEWEIFDLSMSQFLAALLAKKITCKIFPKNFPGAHPFFESSAQ